MNIQHKELASGRWAKMSFAEQMANVGSEVSRALNWREKGKEDLSQRAFNRALELLDMTIAAIKEYSRLKELFRVREAMVDFFCGTNEFLSSETLWRKYFDHFIYLSNKIGGHNTN
jgi:hypothetical protein